MSFRRTMRSGWRTRTGLVTMLSALPLAALVAVPSGSASASASPAVIPCGARTTSTPFKSWGDTANYFTLNGGAFESSPSGWKTTGTTSLASENEPWKVMSGTNAKSLKLSAGSSLTTPSFCVGPSESQFRFFYKSPGVMGSNLKVNVKVELNGWTSNSEWWASGNTGGWFVGPVIPLPNVADSRIQPTVTLTFTPVNSTSASWLIDDLAVDPWKSLR